MESIETFLHSLFEEATRTLQRLQHHFLKQSIFLLRDRSQLDEQTSRVRIAADTLRDAKHLVSSQEHMKRLSECLELSR